MSFEEQKMPQDKYPSIFSRQMDAIVFIILSNIFFTMHSFGIGEYYSDIPSVLAGAYSFLRYA